VTDPVSLRVSGVSKAFGGLVVLDGVSLEIVPGRVTAIIGPNGAGKSTLVGCLIGTVAPDRGEIALGGQEVTRLPPADRARLGIKAMFQEPRLFASMTVRDNIHVALPSVLTLGHRRSIGRERRAREVETAEVQQSLAHVGLDKVSRNRADEVSYGQQKLAAFARSTVMMPRVLLLDEPTAGVAPTLIPQLTALVREMAGKGVAVAMIEHNMDVVTEVADFAYVLDAGRLIAAGTPGDVLSDPLVREVYLGVSSSRSIEG
jgi:ABC-type branched-subunit amino acid transport system ATPase component